MRLADGRPAGVEDVSFVDDDHRFGVDDDGFLHIEGKGFTIQVHDRVIPLEGSEITRLLEPPARDERQDRI